MQPLILPLTVMSGVLGGVGLAGVSGVVMAVSGKTEGGGCRDQLSFERSAMASKRYTISVMTDIMVRV